MAKAKDYGPERRTAGNGSAAAESEEDVGLLAAHADEDGDDGGSNVPPARHGGDDDTDGADGSAAASSHNKTHGGPRTPNRVRFDLGPSTTTTQHNGHAANGTAGAASHGGPPRESFDIDDEDFLSTQDDDDSAHPQQHLRLLTDIEAPSVRLARSPWGAPDDDGVAWAEREQARPKSGLQAAFMNMANSIIGAGIIGQPYAFRQAGLLAGVVLLVGLTFVVDWTICLIVINSKLSGADSFQGTVAHCFGQPGLIAISVAQWAFAFGGMVAFGVIVGDSIPHVLAAVWPGLRDMPVLGLLADRRAVIVLFVLGVSYPLTLYRDIAKLAKASTLALISMAVILIAVLIQGALTPRADRGSFDASLLLVNTGIFQAIGVISFAFVCHHNSLLIYGSLKTPTIDRFSRVTHWSTGVSMLACLLMALAGFLTFGDRTAGNVLNNFAPDNTMVNVARLCFGLNMLTTLPLEAFVCREVMLNYFYPGAPFDLRRHVLVSTGLVVAAMLISLAVCDLGSVFELVGATSACAMAYILPPLCYIKLTTRSWKTYVAGGVVAFGCTVLVMSVVQAVGKLISGGGDAVQCV